MSRKTTLLVGAGIGAVAIGSAAYLLWKYSNDEKSDETFGRHKASRQVTIEIRIPADRVGVVIGRGGETIKEIQRKTQTKIDFNDETEDSKFRVAKIRGSPDEAQLAEILIHQILANQPRIETVELTIPGNSVGRVIGKGGEVIRDIQTRSRCKVEVERSNKGSVELRKVTLRGNSDQISIAQELIEEIVRTTLTSKRRPENLNQSGNSKVPQLFLTAESPVAEEGKNSSSQAETFPSTETLRSGGALDDVIEVYVSSIADPDTFYLQRVGPCSIELDKLITDMTNFYESTENQKKLSLADVKVGDLVATQFPTDKNFYRARIVDIFVDEYDENMSELDIDFVDFGDCQRKVIDEVFLLDKKFMRLNFQAIECSLANVKPMEETWSPKACDDFEQLTYTAQWKSLLARIVPNHESSLSKIFVDLVDTTSSQDVNIAAEMVRLGHAKFIINPNEQSTLRQTSEA